MDGLLELAERCERAMEPDMAIDAMIAKLVHPHGEGLPDMGHDQWQTMIANNPCNTWVPAYTASIDAAMTLVAEGLTFGVYRRVPGEVAGADIDLTFHGNAATLALALCGAALRARAHEADIVKGEGE